MVLVFYKPINTIVLAGLIAMVMHFLQAGKERQRKRNKKVAVKLLL